MASSGSYSLTANKWKTVGGWWGTLSATLCFEVSTSEECRWRRIAAIPGWGKFTGSKCKSLFNGIIQVKSPVDTSCTSWFS